MIHAIRFECDCVIESGGQLDEIYTELSKAFDRINHFVVIKKIYAIGVHSSLLNSNPIIHSYLINREQ